LLKDKVELIEKMEVKLKYEIKMLRRRKL